MNKIIPKISNGRARVLLSETLYIIPSKGLTVTLPITNTINEAKSELKINFSFLSDATAPGGRYETKIDNWTFNIMLYNFLHPRAVGNATPIEIKIGDSIFSLVFVGYSVMNIDNSVSSLQFGLTIFEGAL